MSTPRRRIAPECLSPAGTPNAKGSTNAPVEGRSPTVSAPAPSPTRSEARQPQQPQQLQRQQTARAARAAFRAPAAQQAAPLSAAEQLQQLEEQQVADVAAELKRLQISYASTAQDDLFAGIQLDLKPATLEQLKALSSPPMDDLADYYEGKLGYPKGLQRVLQGTSPARLSRQLLLGRPSLLDLAKHHVRVISKAQIQKLAADICDEKYEGPDLLLDMSQSANEFRFLTDTALRVEEGNVSIGMCLVRDVKQKLTLPLLTVFAVKDLQKGEELLALGDREAASDAREEWEAARQAAKVAAEKLKTQQAAADASPAAKKKMAKVQEAAEAAEEAAEAAEEAAEVAAEQFQGEVLEQLLRSGWRQHTLDVFFQRHAQLAAKLAGAKPKGSKLQQLQAALAAAVERYYGGSSGEGVKEEEQKPPLDGGSGSTPKAASKGGGSSGSSSSSDSGDSGDNGDSDASTAALRELQAALEDSLLCHPPPLSTQQLSEQLSLKPGKQFIPFDSFERPLQKRSDFGPLKPETVEQLDGLEEEPEALPKGCRDRLDSGAAIPGVQVCELVARLHRVRLLTPPNSRALSLHAPPKGKQLQPGECACVYVGRAYEREEADNSESAYLFDITAKEIAAASGAKYKGPSLVVDAAHHRNEAAFANCVFGSDRNCNLVSEVVWDPEHKRPHVALVYTGEQASQPSEELLLDYDFESYWAEGVAFAQKAHEEYAALAGEVILSLREALKEAGASKEELASCLLKVDLAKDHQEYVRVEAA